jgi:hypothetical protein
MVGHKNRLCVVKAEMSLMFRFDIYSMGQECVVTNSVSYLLTEDSIDRQTVEIAWVGFNDLGQVAVMDNYGIYLTSFLF